MTSQVVPSPLTGIIPPMVTPLKSNDELDHEGLERLVEHLIEGGVHGIFALGTTGEAPSLSYALRRELVERVCQQVDGRVPVLVGITDSSFVESVNLAKHAADCGAGGLVLAPPYYFPAGQAELIEYLQDLLPQLPLPLYLYNMPAMTKLVFEPETVATMAELDGVAGLKDSSGNMVYFHTLVRTLSKVRPDFSLLVGPEELLAEAIAFGGHGGVSGGANMFPHLYVDLYNAAVAGDHQRVAALHARVMQISTTIYRVGQHSSSIIKGIKASLSLMGICNDAMAEPFKKFRDQERAMIRQHLDALEVCCPISA